MKWTYEEGGRKVQTEVTIEESLQGGRGGFYNTSKIFGTLVTLKGNVVLQLTR